MLPVRLHTPIAPLLQVAPLVGKASSATPSQSLSSSSQSASGMIAPVASVVTVNG